MIATFGNGYLKLISIPLSKCVSKGLPLNIIFDVQIIKCIYKLAEPEIV